MWPFRRKKHTSVDKSKEDEFMQVLTPAGLTPADIDEIGGLPNEAIVGLIGAPAKDPNKLSAVADEGFSPDEFQPNPAFAVFMHKVIEEFGPGILELQNEAQRQGQGLIYIIDLRTLERPPNVAQEDIIGAFVVENGKLCTYQPNKKHLLFSAKGLVQLPEYLNALHLQHLKRLRVE